MYFHDFERLKYRVLNQSSFGRMQSRRRVETGKYSFKGFDQTQSIFVHIPKAAGVSICTSLYGGLAGGHTRVSRYQLIFSRKEFNQYFKFTFVRNPWDRLYSAYNFLKSGGMNEEDYLWSGQYLGDVNSFEEFVMEWLEAEKVYSYIHFTPQIDFILSRDGESVPLDFIGYFENLSNDFKLVADRLNINSQLSVCNKNQSDVAGRSYKDAYNSNMIDKVALLYKKDIEYLGYEF